MARNLQNLRGKVVLITGGAQGIGKKTATAFVAQGAKVAIGDLDGELAKKTAEEIGGDVIALPLDVTKYDQFEKFIDDAEKALGPVDVLVNNAGVMIVGDFVDEPQRVTDKQLAIDLNAVLFGSREVAKRMIPRRTGHIINIASVAGKVGIPGAVTYNAAKYGVVGLSEALRAELAPDNVQVSIILPGFVKTELIAGLEEGNWLNKVIKPLPPEKVAAAIVRAAAGKGMDAWVPGVLRLFDTTVRPLPFRARQFYLARVVNVQKMFLPGVNSPERQKYRERTTGQAD